MDEISIEAAPSVGAISINQALVGFISAASGIIEFDLFKSTVLNAAVYADKALYVHSMMVKEICLDIVSNSSGCLTDDEFGKNKISRQIELLQQKAGKIKKRTEEMAMSGIIANNLQIQA